MTDKKYVVVYMDEHNNHVIDIPEEVLKTLGWKDGTDVSLTVENGQIVVKEARISKIVGNRELI
jgi:antitoxin component of MazEF toxin-antitoxin module